MTRASKTPSNGGKPSKPPRAEQIQMQIRVPREFLDLVDQHVEALNKGKSIPVATRSSVIKQCLQSGWDLVQKSGS